MLSQEEKYLKPRKYMPDDFCNVKPFNFYESPYADMEEVHKEESDIWGNRARSIEGIDFNDKRQMQLLDEMTRIPAHIWPDKAGGSENRYYYDNWMFGKGSADVLYYMMRIIEPKRIIEVGSGFSTAAMVDVNEQYFDGSIDISCIEPDTGRLRKLLKPSDKVSINETKLQMVSEGFFDILDRGDILFIDSSHVAKVNGDVNYYFFEIFPRLKSGVYVHIHDIPYPMEYYKPWVYEGRAYNELYLLRAFLMYNSLFSIQFFGEYLMDQYSERIPKEMTEIGGSIWLRKE